MFSLVILFGAHFDDDDVVVAILLSRRRIRSRVCFLFGRNRRCEQIGRFRDWFARKRGHKSAAAFVVHRKKERKEEDEEPRD